MTADKISAREVEKTATEATRLKHPRNLSYNTGHGDFCFGQVPIIRSLEHIDRKIDDNSDEAKAEVVSFTGKCYVPVEELDGFERSGPFPFMKLPHELRRKIYGHLLRLVRVEGYFELGNYIPSATFINIRKVNKANLSRRTIEGHAARGQFDNISQCIPHPGRPLTCHLAVHSGPHKYGDWAPGPTQAELDQPVHELVRNFANTSCRIRSEMAYLLWQNVSICSWGFATFGRELYHFLQHRPAIHKSIKHLYVSQYEDYYLQNEQTNARYVTACHFMGEFLELESLHLTITIEASVLDEKWEHLESVRCLNVTELFEFNLVVVPDDPFPHGPDYDYQASAEWEQTRSSLWAEHYVRIRDLLMPNTLRCKAINDKILTQGSQNDGSSSRFLERVAATTV